MKFADLSTVKANAKIRYAEIKAKYPKISGYTVFASRGGQAKLSDDSVAIFKSFLDFYVEGEPRRIVQSHFARIHELEKEPKPDRKAIDQLQELARAQTLDLEVNQYVHVEVRFDELDFDIVKTLRSDADLVDVERTPQIAGIRIVLGTLLSFL